MRGSHTRDRHAPRQPNVPCVLRCSVAPQCRAAARDEGVGGLREYVVFSGFGFRAPFLPLQLTDPAAANRLLLKVRALTAAIA